MHLRHILPRTKLDNRLVRMVALTTKIVDIMTFNYQIFLPLPKTTSATTKIILQDVATYLKRTLINRTVT